MDPTLEIAARLFVARLFMQRRAVAHNVSFSLLLPVEASDAAVYSGLLKKKNY